jgi:hypothetical protein
MISKDAFDVTSMIAQFDMIYDMSFSFVTTRHVEARIDCLKRIHEVLEYRSTFEEEGSLSYMKFKHGSLLILEVILHLV